MAANSIAAAANLGGESGYPYRHTSDARSPVGAAQRTLGAKVQVHLTVEPATPAETEADEADVEAEATAVITATATKQEDKNEVGEGEEEREVFVSIDLSDLSERRELLPRGGGDGAREAVRVDVDSPRGLAAQRGAACFFFSPLLPSRTRRASTSKGNGNGTREVYEKISSSSKPLSAAKTSVPTDQVAAATTLHSTANRSTPVSCLPRILFPRRVALAAAVAAEVGGFPSLRPFMKPVLRGLAGVNPLS
jgi:hypothetical protein